MPTGKISRVPYIEESHDNYCVFVKFCLVSVAFITMLVSCQRVDAEINSQDNIDATNLLYETSTFSCYSIEPDTKSGDVYDRCIVVNQSPDLEILMGRYPQTKESDSYEYVASIKRQNEEPFLMLFEQEMTDSGYLLKYLIDDTETMEFLVPFADGCSTTKGMGQDTMDCITDVYTNHGWVSVWVWVQTAFIPETAAAFAAVCAANQVYTKRKSTK